MADLLAAALAAGLTSRLARRVGVPQPPRLRRYEPGAPICEGPVLVAGGGRFTRTVEDLLRDRALAGVTVVPAAGPPLGAVVLDLSEAADPADLDVLRAVGAPAVRRLRPGGRVVVIGTDPHTLTDVAAAATHRALEGFTRSLGKELGGGATANLVLAQGDAHGGVRSATQFLLSGRSAFVDGQALRVSGAEADAPGDPVTPLTGKVAVVTGAARGIGAEIAAVLARDGATVVAVDVPAAGEPLVRVANDVRGTALQLDVTAPDAGGRIVEHAVSRHGSLDIVVHNAGITRDRLLVNLDEPRWRSVLDVNLRSVLRMNESLLATGGIAQGGRVVCLASVSGIAGNRGQANYAASKAGVIGLVEALAPQLRDRGVTVNAVAPGFIETQMTARIPPVRRELGRRLSSLQQGGSPRDVAETVAWLSQPGASGITGQVVRVCGQSLLGS